MWSSPAEKVAVVITDPRQLAMADLFSFAMETSTETFQACRGFAG